MDVMSAIGQLLDFVFKACKAYVETPEGAKELNDVIVALEGDNVAPSETARSSYRG